MKIKFENLAYKKLLFYVNNCDIEISGYGKSRVEGNEIIIEDIGLIKQECTGTNTDIDDEATMLFFQEKMRGGEDVKKWNVWWHSHVDFGVFWSTTDEKTAAEMSSGGDYLISIVANKKGDYLGRIDIFPKNKSPFKTQIKLHEKIDIKGEDIALIATPETKERGDELDKQIAELKKQKEDLIKDQVKDNDLELLIIDEIKEKVKPKYKTVRYLRDDDYDYYGYSGWRKNTFKKDIFDSYGNNHSKKKKTGLNDKDYYAYCPHCGIGSNIYENADLYTKGICPKCNRDMLKEVQEVEFEIENYWKDYKTPEADMVTEDATVVCENCNTKVHLDPKTPMSYLCPKCSRDLLAQYNDSKKKVLTKVSSLFNRKKKRIKARNRIKYTKAWNLSLYKNQ